MRRFVMPSPPARILRAGATLLTAGAVALGGLAPAQAAVEASDLLSFTCSTGKGTKKFTATFDTDAPVQMYVGDPAKDVTLDATVTLPNGGYVYSYWLAAKRKVRGPLDFNATIGEQPVKATLDMVHDPEDAWFGSGATWPLQGSARIGQIDPTTAGDVPVRVGVFNGTLTWRDGYNNLPVRDTVSCSPDATSGTTVDTVRVVSRSHVSVETPVSDVQQGSGARVTAVVGVDGGTVAGKVRFSAGTVSVDVPVDSTGRVTGTLPVLAPGAYEVTAEFLPADTVHYVGSSSQPAPFTVRAARATSVSLTAPSSALTTESVQLRAVVSADGTTEPPAGRVDFTVDNTVVATSAISQTGVATALVSDLRPGSRVVQARFVSADTNRHLSSASADRTIQVVAPAAATETVLTVQPDTVAPDQRATVTAQVFSGQASPSGSVDFTVENDEGFFETYTAGVVNGQASVQLPTLGLGSYSVTATFGPADPASFNPSQSAVRTLSVKAVAPTVTTTTLTLDPATVDAGQISTATVEVTPATGTAQPSGTVSVSVDGRTVEGPVVNGRAVLDLPAVVEAGPYPVVASFTPANPGTFGSSRSTARTLTVRPRPAVATQTDLFLSRSSVTVGDDVTASASVQPTTAVGRVEFTVDGAVMRADVVDGVAQVSLPLLAVGNHDVKARFVPADPARHEPSSSALRQLTVAERPAAATTTVLSLSRSSATTAQSVTATAEVASDFGRPAGTVTFTAGNVSETAPVLGGTAEIQFGALPPGTVSVQARFNPADAGKHLSSIATPRQLTVTQAPAEATVTTLTLLNNPVVAGQQAEVGIEVVAAAGKADGTVTLTVDGRTVRGVEVVDGLASAALPEVTTPGQYPVTAAFTPAAGSSLRASQDVRTLTVIVAPGNVASATVVTLDRRAVEQGSPVTATAQVVVPGLPADGEVTFRAVSGTSVQTITAPVTGGEASVVLPSLAVGTWSVTGAYQPSRGGVTPSTSNPATLVVSAASAQLTQTELTLSSDSVLRGEQVEAEASVRTTSGAAQGEVTFSIGDLSTTAPVVGGKARATVPLVGTGVHQVVATFVPDSPVAQQGSVSPAVRLTVQDTTSLVLSLSAVSSASDRPVTATAAVSSSGAAPTGTVLFSVGGRETSAPVVEGRAAATLPGLAPGQYTVRATYLPARSTVRGSAGQQALRVTEPVDPPVTGPETTSLNLTTSAASAPYGKRVRALAQVPVGAEGMVAFSAGGQTLEVKVVQGRAAAKLPVVAVGSHEVTATYLPADPLKRQPATASTALRVVKDSVKITFGKRWSHPERRLTHTTRVRPRNGSPAVGMTTVVLQKKVGKKYRTISRRTGELGGNGYVRFSQKLRLPVTGTYRVRVTYKGSPSLKAATFTKSFRIG